MPEAKSIYIHTVGCAKNLVDSEILLGKLAGKLKIVDEANQADLIVINSCGFINTAREESIDAVMEAVALKKDTQLAPAVVMMGCLSERYREDIKTEIPELDGIYGVGEFTTMVEDIFRFEQLGVVPERSSAGQKKDDLSLFTNRVLLSPAHSVFLRISDGCDQSCTYCSIPLMRGKMRSRPIKDLLSEGENLLERGAKEINIIGQEISSYGMDIYDKPVLPDLLRQLDGLGAPWIRLLYTHPPKVDLEFAETVAALKSIVPYIDFPVEHVSGNVLKRMRRKGDADSIKKQIEMLRDTIPGLILRTSIIVGFPGESDADFKELLDFVAMSNFDRLGAFIWSPEEGTPSIKLKDRIQLEVAEDRRRQLMEKQMEVSYNANQKLIGLEDRILIDESDKTTAISYGRSYRDAFEIDNSVEINGYFKSGEFVNVIYTDASEYDLYADPV
jgi:ribosomal protein S12 methylthiotransferase